MWEDVCLPRAESALVRHEALVAQFAAEQMRAYDGAVFLCVAKNDRARRNTFRQAARSLGLRARDGEDVFEEFSAEELAKRPERQVLFVTSAMESYLGAYLNACPAGARHLLLYTRRRGNGPSLRMSRFLDFWRERGVDIFDFGQADQENPVTPQSVALRMETPVSWQGRWWLLDLETSGVDWAAHDLIALRLARMENCSILEERQFLIRPRQPLQPWAEQVTGVSNQDLAQAVPLQEAVAALEALDGPLLFLDRDFALPFLEQAFSRCGKAFHLPCLLLDRLAALSLDGSPKQKTERFLEQLPPPAGWEDGAPRSPDLRQLYQLALAEFTRLEQTHGVANTAQLADFQKSEASI